MLVYAGEPEEYFLFITPEAYDALKAYMDFRALWGEQITEESWLIRDYFRTADVKRKSTRIGRTGVASKPEILTSKSMNRMLLRALYDKV